MPELLQAATVSHDWDVCHRYGSTLSHEEWPNRISQKWPFYGVTWVATIETVTRWSTAPEFEGMGTAVLAWGINCVVACSIAVSASAQPEQARVNTAPASERATCGVG